MIETKYWIWLTQTLGFSAGSINKVLRKLSPDKAYLADKEAFLTAGIDEKLADKLLDKSLEKALTVISKCEKKGIKIIPSDSTEYPRALDRLDDKPNVLYVRGDIGCLEGKKTAAFVGTRRMSKTALPHALELANSLIDDGYVLVSGIAEGVDTVAAQVSLERGVPTVAIMGVDIDKYFPASNRALIDKIAERGAVVSEYPPDTNSRYFATRNRIITGLSDIFNVLEAPVGSGALIGARVALKKKIPTYALCLEGKSFDGCRELLELGAKPLGKSESAKKKSPAKPKGIPDEIQGIKRHILETLALGPCDDSSFLKDGYSISQVLCTLTELELLGYIESLPGGKYKLK